jgi:hypothetical protein
MMDEDITRQRALLNWWMQQEDVYNNRMDKPTLLHDEQELQYWDRRAMRATTIMDEHFSILYGLR